MGDLVCGRIFFLTYSGVGFFLSSIICHERLFFFSVGIFFLPGIPLQEFFPLEISLRDIFSDIIHTLPPPLQKSNGRPLIRSFSAIESKLD